MAAGLGPAWPQLSPLQPGTGKQNIFTFRWDLGACKSLQMPFAPLGCAVSAVRPCSRRVPGMDLVHPNAACGGLGLGRDRPLVSCPGQGC